MIFNVTGGGGGIGCTLTITAPVGATVTISKDGKSKPSKVATTGTVVFKGLETGTWTITISNGTETASKTIEIKADYQAEITFFSSTINIAYPAGLACTATDGVTTLTAPDTSGTWACVVPNAGTWTITAGDFSADAVMTTSGQTETVRVARWIVKNGVPTDIGFATKLFTGTGYTITQESGYVHLKTTKDNCVVLSDAMVDFGNVKTVIADIDAISVSTSSSYAVFRGNGIVLTNNANLSGLSPALNAIKHNAISKDKGRQILSLDATSITGTWYVGISMGGNAGEVNVYNLRAEV